MLTLDDVEKATNLALERFSVYVWGSFEVQLSVGTVNILNNESSKHMWNYNIPLMYEMDERDIAPLRAWWKTVHPSGDVLPRENKHDHYLINVVWTTRSGRLFNMHVAVTGP